MILEITYRAIRKGENLALVRLQREMEDAHIETELDKSGELYVLKVRQGRHRKANVQEEQQAALPMSS